MPNIQTYINTTKQKSHVAKTHLERGGVKLGGTVNMLQCPSTGVVIPDPRPESAGLGLRELSNSSSCCKKLRLGDMFDFCILTWSYALFKVC